MSEKMNTVLLDQEKVVPGKVVCVGRNYVEHIRELGNEMPTSMVLFMKPNSSVSDTLATRPGRELHYEGEISLMVKAGRFQGVGFGLDLTDRGTQSELKARGLPWERAKAFDGAAVFSSFVSIRENEVEALSLQLWINDELRQEGDISLMIFKPQDILGEIQSFSALEDGDIVMTGTPKGVGAFAKGDKFVGKIFLGGKEILEAEWVAK
jgi:2-keto-4-pentenoate hydratase/2-oxohepta-3-ene-1,7-dioic acid hydratase in catechol pathway